MKQCEPTIFSGSNLIYGSRFFGILLLLILCAAPTFAQISPVVPETTAVVPTNVIIENRPAPPPASTADQTSSENLVHNGDTIDIDVLGSLEYDWRGKADSDGNLSNLPDLINSIQALCRSENEITADVTAAYEKFLANPRIVVHILDRSERQPAILFGAVRTPQRFQIQRQVHLKELIVMSGGISDQASGEIQFFRPAHVSCASHGQAQQESLSVKIKILDLLSGKPEANPVVRAGDVITVEEASPIYVTGGVANPQKIFFRTGITLSRVISSVGGLSRKADKTKIFIFRRQKNESNLKVIEVNLDKIARKEISDVALEPFDIIEVAQTGRLNNRRPTVNDEQDAKQFNLNQLPSRVVN